MMSNAARFINRRALGRDRQRGSRIRRHHSDANAEVITRRFARLSDGTGETHDSSFASAPNLVVIDGGKAQLSAALAAMQAFDLPRVAVIALAQPDGRIETIAADPSAWGDVVLGRKETPTSYHVSVVIDDAAQGVTDIVRGQDLFAATGVHRLLQILLDLPEPAYRHRRLVLDAEGRKLAKSSRSTALRALRQQGVTPGDIPAGQAPSPAEGAGRAGLVAQPAVS